MRPTESEKKNEPVTGAKRAAAAAYLSNETKRNELEKRPNHSKTFIHSLLKQTKPKSSNGK